MREPLEMVTASLMQNMVQIHKKNIYFATKIIFGLFIFLQMFVNIQGGLARSVNGAERR